jgi:hypothetical protein
MIPHWVTELFASACPWLLLTVCLHRLVSRTGMTLQAWRRLWLAGLVAMLVLLIPIEGIAIARWIAGVSANFSIPSVCLLAVVVWQRTSARQIFSVADWGAAWTFGAVGGLVLYPLALGVGSLDPYTWGWRISPLFVANGAITGWLIWKQNRFGIVLLLAALAFHLQLEESSNYWDYLLDPIYSLVSLVALAGRAGIASTSSSLIKRFSNTSPRNIPRI